MTLFRLARRNARQIEKASLFYGRRFWRRLRAGTSAAARYQAECGRGRGSPICPSSGRRGSPGCTSCDAFRTPGVSPAGLKSVKESGLTCSAPSPPASSADRSPGLGCALCPRRCHLRSDQEFSREQPSRPTRLHSHGTTDSLSGGRATSWSSPGQPTKSFQSPCRMEGAQPWHPCQLILWLASAVSNEGRSSPLLALLPAVSWPWVPAWGSLEPPRRDGENAQKTRKNGEKMGEIRPKTCKGVGITWAVRQTRPTLAAPPTYSPRLSRWIRTTRNCPRCGDSLAPLLFCGCLRQHSERIRRRPLLLLGPSLGRRSNQARSASTSLLLSLSPLAS